MGASGNKLLLNVAGRPVLAWTLETVLRCEVISWVGLIGQPVDEAAIGAIIEAAAPRKPVRWIVGGDTRQESVSRWLRAAVPPAPGVLIHDGARCLVEPELLERCAAAVAAGRAVIAATPVTDTIKQVDAAGSITATPERSRLWAAQTPQGFGVEQLRSAHAQARREGWDVTDDAALFERLGLAVQVLEAPASNIKLTTPFDLTVAEAVLSQRCLRGGSQD